MKGRRNVSRTLCDYTSSEREDRVTRSRSRDLEEKVGTKANEAEIIGKGSANIPCQRELLATRRELSKNSESAIWMETRCH